MSGGNKYDPMRDYVDKHRPPGVSQVYDGGYKAGKFTGDCVDKVIKEVEKYSSGAGAAARVVRGYVEEKLPIFQDNRPHKN
jgi:hypothetical protein